VVVVVFVVVLVLLLEALDVALPPEPAATAPPVPVVVAPPVPAVAVLLALAAPPVLVAFVPPVPFVAPPVPPFPPAPPAPPAPPKPEPAVVVGPLVGPVGISGSSPHPQNATVTPRPNERTQNQKGRMQAPPSRVHVRLQAVDVPSAREAML